MIKLVINKSGVPFAVVDVDDSTKKIKVCNSGNKAFSLRVRAPKTRSEKQSVPYLEQLNSTEGIFTY